MTLLPIPPLVQLSGMYNVMPLVGKLEELALNCLDLDAEKDSAEQVRFTDEDLINALVIFNTVVGNRAVNTLIDLNLDLEMGNQAMKGYGNLLRQTFKTISGIDPQEYFAHLNK